MNKIPPRRKAKAAPEHDTTLDTPDTIADEAQEPEQGQAQEPAQEQAPEPEQAPAQEQAPVIDELHEHAGKNPVGEFARPASQTLARLEQQLATVKGLPQYADLEASLIEQIKALTEE